MNILFVVPYTPNLIRTRPYNLVRGLARRGNRVTLASLWETKEEREALHRFEQEGIRVICAPLTKRRSIWNAFWALPTTTPLQAAYCWQPALAEMLALQIRKEQYDAIHVEHLRGARYGLWLKSHLPTLEGQPRVIWDSVDCISFLFEQAIRSSRSLFGKLISRLDLGRTRRYEAWLVGKFDKVLVTSPVDKGALAQLGSKYGIKANGNANEAIAVLPNGVDLDFFVPTDQPREVNTLVFSGKMSYHANVTGALHLVNEIMPLIWAKKPSTRVWIVGKDPSDAVRQLAIRHPQHVVVTGTVPDIRPYLGHATIAVCPVRYGAGIQNKILEAMAMATPVTTTPQGVSALQTHGGEEVLVAESAEEFAKSVLQLMEDSALRLSIGQSGRSYVKQHHDWKSIVEDLEAFYQRGDGDHDFNGRPWRHRVC